MYNVILPTYNEVHSIAPLLRMLRSVFERLNVPYRIVVVDDDSPDATKEIVRGLQMEHIHLVVRKGKQGLGSAYVEGLRHCPHPYTILMDADLQHDPFSILEMAKKVEDCDIVTGTRYKRGGKVCSWPFMRRLTSRFANNIARYVLGLVVSDLTGSFRIYKTECLRRLIDEVGARGFGFQMEALARAELSGMRIRECPITFYDRQGGESKLGAAEAIKFLAAVARMYVTL